MPAEIWTGSKAMRMLAIDAGAEDPNIDAGFIIEASD